MRPAKVAAGSSQSYTFLRASETNVRQSAAPGLGTRGWDQQALLLRCFACARQRWQPAASRATFQRVSERVVRTGQVHAAWPPAIGWFCIPDTRAHTPTYTPTHTPTHTHTRPHTHPHTHTETHTLYATLLPRSPHKCLSARPSLFRSLYIYIYMAPIQGSAPCAGD